MIDDDTTRDAERAAQQANGEAAKAVNLTALAQLHDSADSAQRAEHIRGIVATTIAHLAAVASAATRHSAAQWQAWALGLSDALVPDAPPAVGA
jgi:uncharacterized membrane protein